MPAKPGVISSFYVDFLINIPYVNYPQTTQFVNSCQGIYTQCVINL